MARMGNRTPSGKASASRTGSGESGRGKSAAGEASRAGGNTNAMTKVNIDDASKDSGDSEGKGKTVPASEKASASRGRGAAEASGDLKHGSADGAKASFEGRTPVKATGMADAPVAKEDAPLFGKLLRGTKDDVSRNGPDAEGAAPFYGAPKKGKDVGKDNDKNKKKTGLLSKLRGEKGLEVVADADAMGDGTEGADDAEGASAGKKDPADEGGGTDGVGKGGKVSGLLGKLRREKRPQEAERKDIEGVGSSDEKGGDARNSETTKRTVLLDEVRGKSHSGRESGERIVGGNKRGFEDGVDPDSLKLESEANSEVAEKASHAGDEDGQGDGEEKGLLGKLRGNKKAAAAQEQ